MKINDVLACSFSSWYDLFKRHTIKSEIINLPDEILEFIEHAPLILPKNSRPIEVKKGEYSDSDEEPWSDEEDENMLQPHFPDFEKRVNEIIERWGGCIFPKLNWSAPKDAAWVKFGNSLKCNSAADILLLLKASDFVSHDLYTPFSLCSDFAKSGNVSPPQLTLVLREWRNFKPDCEFRCFIKSNAIVAICQRNIDFYSVFIKTEKLKIIRAIDNFFRDVIKDNFALSDYVLDLYVSHKLDTPSCVKIVDFNVFGPPTDSLLFTWEELHDFSSSREVELRQQENKNLQSANLAQYKIPIDLVDISTGNDPEKLIDLVQAHVEEQKKSNQFVQS